MLQEKRKCKARFALKTYEVPTVVVLFSDLMGASMICLNKKGPRFLSKGCEPWVAVKAGGV